MPQRGLELVGVHKRSYPLSAMGAVGREGDRQFHTFLTTGEDRMEKGMTDMLVNGWFSYFVKAQMGREDVHNFTQHGRIRIDVPASEAYLSLYKILKSASPKDTNPKKDHSFEMIRKGQRVFFALLPQEKKDIFVQREDSALFDMSAPSREDIEHVIGFIKKSEWYMRG